MVYFTNDCMIKEWADGRNRRADPFRIQGGIIEK